MMMSEELFYPNDQQRLYRCRRRLFYDGMIPMVNQLGIVQNGTTNIDNNGIATNGTDVVLFGQPIT